MIKRFSLCIAALLIMGIAEGYAGFDDHFYRKTLRVDYIHTGNSTMGEITLDKLISEPWWGGSVTQLIDTFGYGRYYFEVRDAKTKKLLYSRGYSTLFVEWQDTEEARDSTRSFNESLVMPFPRKEVVVEIFSRDKQNRLHSIFSLRIHPKDKKIITRKAVNFPVKEIIVNGKPEDKLDIVFIGDGYREDEAVQFWAECEKFAGYLLNASPFNEFRQAINIRGISAISDDSGISLPGEGIHKRTALGTSFYTFGSERYLMAEDFHKVRDVAGLVPYDQIFIIANSDKYGGGGIYNFYSTGSGKNKDAAFLLIHEFGHAFAGLGDEYYTSEVAVDAFYDLSTEPWEPNITTLVNFSTKWADMVAPGTGIPTPPVPENMSVVGVYEGGGYLEKGIYRPYIDCTMKSVKYDAFCPVCKRAIGRMIRFYGHP